MQKHVNLVDLVKSFPTTILVQNLASIQKRTNPLKFGHLAGKSEKGSISNLSTKRRTGRRSGRRPVLRLVQDGLHHLALLEVALGVQPEAHELLLQRRHRKLAQLRELLRMGATTRTMTATCVFSNLFSNVWLIFG